MYPTSLVIKLIIHVSYRGLEYFLKYFVNIIIKNSYNIVTSLLLSINVVLMIITELFLLQLGFIIKILIDLDYFES